MRSAYSLVILLLAITWLQRPTTPFLPRENYGSVLEPLDRIMHGAGQDAAGFRNYWDAMDAGERPLAYMTYIGLRNVSTTWADRLKTDLLPYLDHMTVLQVGLELTADGIPYTEEVARGTMDEEIARVLDGFEEIGLPVYLRIGYEFNGVAWNGYQPASYQAAFRYITRKIRERDLEIATVWDFAPDGDSDFMAYFPGDDFVDWWAFNPFSVSHLTHPDVYALLDSAAVHLRPVMIGESTPRFVGTTGGQTSWDQWFAPYFDLIHRYPGIKMFSYINWNWADWPQWSNWGDARLEVNQVVRDLYAAEMDSADYLHAGTEREFRSLLGYADAQPPPTVAGMTVADSTYPAGISWNPVADVSGIARYLITVDGLLYDYTGRTAFSFDRAQPGDTLAVSVVAVDRAGNAGAPSAEQSIVIPARGENPAEQIVNGGFEQGQDPWELAIFVSNAAATFDVDTQSPIAGSASAHLNVTATTGTNWHLQLRHPVRVSASKRYVITYEARASQATTMETWLQQDHSPFDGYAFRTVQLSTDAQAYRDTAFVDTDDTTFLTFMVGSSGTPEIWIDNVSVVEEDWTPQPEALIENGGFETGLDPWTLDRSGLARASVDIDDTGQIAGQNAAHVTIIRTTGTNWHVQLRQRMDVRAGRRYVVRYQARANTETTMETWLQQTQSPYLGYLEKPVSLTTGVQAFADTVVVPQDDAVFLAFMMGASGLSEIWIDDVSVEEVDVTTGVERDALAEETFRLDTPYPVPAQLDVHVRFELTRPSHVVLRVFDAVGRRVATLNDNFRQAGTYNLRWDAGRSASGVYVVRMFVDGRWAASRTVVLTR